MPYFFNLPSTLDLAALLDASATVFPCLPTLSLEIVMHSCPSNSATQSLVTLSMYPATSFSSLPSVLRVRSSATMNTRSLLYFAMSLSTGSSRTK